MKKTVALIALPSPLLYEPTIYAPLGLLYLASILLREQYKVKFIDLRASKLDLTKIPRKGIDFYGVSGTTTEAVDSRKVAKFLKGKGVTMVGGAHASNCPDYFVDYYDAIVQGDGEISILDIIERGERGLIMGKPVKDIDTIPFPARHLLPRNRIIAPSLWGGYGCNEERPDCTTIITTRGCPFNCAFCANIPQRVRYHSPEYIAAEFKHLIKTYNVRHFDVLDDSFTLNKKRMGELAPLLEPLKIKFRAQGRADALNDERCALLKQMGCTEVQFGLEHADNGVLKLLGKHETVEDMSRAMEMIKAHGMGTKIFLMAGLPGETWETIENTKQWIRDTQPDKAPPTLFVPFPGCDIWKNPEKYGVRILTKDFSKYFMREPAHSVIETDLASSEELTAHYYDLKKFILEGKWRKKKNG